MPKKVGLLVGRERSFPDALIAEVNGRGQDVVAEYAQVEATRIDAPPRYEVLVDRISHDIPHYQPVLKLAALNGTYVVNNPFWRIADDKFIGTALARKLGVAVPKTAVLPAREYNPDVNSQSLERNMRYVDWDGLGTELGYPMYMKPHWGGGWYDVHRVSSKEELLAKFDQTGQKTMIVQEEIRWQQYVRCIVVGQEQVRPALWNPKLSHFDRYRLAEASMPTIPPQVMTRVEEDARKLCRALGYDMNTVEFALVDGVPYAIDFMNSAPDLDISSLGPDHFAWVVQKMADLVIEKAKSERKSTSLPRWDTLLGG